LLATNAIGLATETAISRTITSYWISVTVESWNASVLGVWIVPVRLPKARCHEIERRGARPTVDLIGSEETAVAGLGKESPLPNGAGKRKAFS